MEQVDVNLQEEVQGLQGQGFMMDTELMGRILACDPAGEGEPPITIELLRTGTQRFLTASPSVFSVRYFLSDTLCPLSIQGSAFQLAQTVSYVAEVIAPGIFSGNCSVDNLLRYESNAIELERQLSSARWETDELKEKLQAKEVLCEQYACLVGKGQAEIQQLKDRGLAVLQAQEAEVTALRSEIRALRQESREKSVEFDRQQWESKGLKDQTPLIGDLSERNRYLTSLLQACPLETVAKAEAVMRRRTGQNMPLLYPADMFVDDTDHGLDTAANPEAAIPLPLSPPGDVMETASDGRVSPLVFGAKARRSKKLSAQIPQEKTTKVAWQNPKSKGDKGADIPNQETIARFLAQNLASYPDAPPETLVNFSFQMAKLFQQSGLNSATQGQGRNANQSRPSKIPTGKTTGTNGPSKRPQNPPAKSLSDIDRELRTGLGGAKTPPANTGNKPSKQSYAEAAQVNDEGEWRTVRTRRNPVSEKNLSLPSSRGTRANELHLSLGVSDGAKRLTSKLLGKRLRRNDS